MTDADRKLLNDNGWLVECESPLEIMADGATDLSSASGRAAEIVLESLRTQPFVSTQSSKVIVSVDYLIEIAEKTSGAEVWCALFRKIKQMYG
jgi:hypothetical protein